MRFAYIDSNGNEVPIPSVDALALRIELGAITENTQLYDAQADQWGPAHTHEIFHSLSRSKEEEGFVAPPPVAPPVAPPPTAPPVAADPPAVQATEEEDEAPASGGDSDFGLTLADPQESPDEAGAPTPNDLGLTLADAQPEDPAGEADDGGDVGAFDFGDMGSELEMEEPEADDDPMDLTPSPSFDATMLEAGGSDSDLGGGLELDSPMDFSAGAAGDGGLDLEAPMSDFTPEDPPSWMETGSEEEDDVLDFSSSATTADGAGAEEKEVPLRERRTPRNKPSPPKLRKQRNLAGPLVAVVALLAVGLGGYVAWPLVSDRLAARGEPDEPAVFLPPIPDERVPEMREIAGAALAAVIDAKRAEWAAGNPVASPPREWLAGAYLANASRFTNVAPFWDDMSIALSSMRGIGLSEFDAAFAAEAQRRGTADADLLRTRADSGFVAAAAVRADIYDGVANLIDAAEQLHDFLIANEDRIEYAPASTVTTDPVLEATATPQIKAVMQDLIDDITRALAAIGYRDAVTADGLWNNVRARARERGVL